MHHWKHHAFVFYITPFLIVFNLIETLRPSSERLAKIDYQQSCPHYPNLAVLGFVYLMSHTESNQQGICLGKGQHWVIKLRCS